MGEWTVEWTPLRLYMTTRAPAVLITTAIPKARGPKARSPIRAPSILVDPGRLTRSLLKSEK